MAMKPTYEELEQKIKELKKLETKLDDTKAVLEESEERYRRLFEMIPSSIVIIGVLF